MTKPEVNRGDRLPELRRNASYAAHVEQNADARDDLDAINAEIATHQSELASLDDAIAAAKNRVVVAQAMEKDSVDRAKAKEAVEVLEAFRKAGHDLDNALRAIADKGAKLNELLFMSIVRMM
jgi:hypothetical protein